MNSRQRIFAENYVKGMSASQAYCDAGYSAKGKAAESAAQRLLRNVLVSAYITEMQEAAKDAAIATVRDRLVFLSLSLITPLSEIDETNPLCVEMTVDTIGEEVVRKKIKKVDPLRAADLLNKMTGAYTPQKVEVSADDELTSILAGIAKAGANQDDKM